MWDVSLRGRAYSVVKAGMEKRVISMRKVLSFRMLGVNKKHNIWKEDRRVWADGNGGRYLLGERCLQKIGGEPLNRSKYVSSKHIKLFDSFDNFCFGLEDVAKHDADKGQSSPKKSSQYGLSSLCVQLWKIRTYVPYDFRLSACVECLEQDFEKPRIFISSRS
jgi:hypothetical protein